MTTQLKNFFFHDGSVEAKSVRVLDCGGDPWFVAKDVCEALAVKNTSQAVAKIDSSRKSMLNIGLRGSPPLCVNEAGLYDLILQSRKPEAREFKAWVTGTVLPAIRKDGAYIMGEEKVATGELDEEAFVLKAIEILQRKIERLSSENKNLTHERDGLSSVVGQHTHTIARFARTLPGVNSMKVKADLLEEGYLYKKNGTYRVYRKFSNLFEEKFNEVHGTVDIFPTEAGKRLLARMADMGYLTKLKSAA